MSNNVIDAFGYQISGDLAAAVITVPLVALFVVVLGWVFRNERGSDDLGSGIRGTENGGNGGNHRRDNGGIANDR